MDRTDSRLALSPEPASDDAASPFNPRTPPPGDLLDFEPVPLRHRTGGLTPAKQREYVEALADTGLVREAAARIGVSEQAINRIRRRSDARQFDRACEAAHLMGARRLRSIAFERAIEGTLKGHYYHGERVGEERVFDNRLLIYLLGKTEHLLEPPAEARAVCASWEPHMEALERGLPPPAAEPEDEHGDEDFIEKLVWKNDEGELRTCFPPPEGFEGIEQGIYDGEGFYCRSLSEPELAFIEAANVRSRAADHALRDRFFGFAGGEFSGLGEAETSETNETSENPSFRRSMSRATPKAASKGPEPMNTDRAQCPPAAFIDPGLRRDDARAGDVPYQREPCPKRRRRRRRRRRQLGSALPVIPAKAGTPGREVPAGLPEIPALAGMTLPTSKPHSPGILGNEPPGETP